MAKLTIGSILKGKKLEDGSVSPDYIKVNADVTLKKGEFLNLESKQFQLDSIEEGVRAGRLTDEFATKLRDRANKIPDFVRFDVTKTVKKS